MLTAFAVEIRYCVISRGERRACTRLGAESKSAEFYIYKYLNNYVI